MANRPVLIKVPSQAREYVRWKEFLEEVKKR
jgi:hypothetical protein